MAILWSLWESTVPARTVTPKNLHPVSLDLDRDAQFGEFCFKGNGPVALLVGEPLTSWMTLLPSQQEARETRGGRGRGSRVASKTKGLSPCRSTETPPSPPAHAGPNHSPRAPK